ncbi:ribonuclease HII [Wolbachia endosymbiont of Diaphorina citri]|jgi:Ribonuclease HII|uniref:ribonuclease HII n=1 Tax=Wolbachia endosymbiont of Diaphorina citri TaxID=116598 RepID=UPI0002E069EA|nr:ribonuclease HII [Wolbachia endosymbiont of Diaphorina citri]QJT94299.1 ribonuclease HII [Wolbachia endosymbiont of Diaphorina citri]QJT95540.1 ribonuclease HII [Wolbachia endosymbiont of Diaphorina citri]QJT96901.1 ribonuclease HII [Wolbachia endosymbiont of Diaphorina citri]QLK11197.1 ribonuclease HII [Wolbachia endosymbiont of Diaphorina citri]QXY87271.1 ribonuclease HII [Wolbachia endosymbiont of Diaphorina citri]
MKYPDFSLENTLSGIIAGVDEVGRGPLAGPVISAAVIFTDRDTVIDGINDSKKLTPKCRQVLYEKITSVAKFGIGMASVEEINSYNILQATKLSMKRALANLNLELDYVLVDGNQPPEVKWQVKSIVNGDSLSISIAAASIVAKVTRDRLMEELHNKHPQYNWHKNKGYGTKEHLSAIGLHGITKHHRKNFAPIRTPVED